MTTRKAVAALCVLSATLTGFARSQSQAEPQATIVRAGQVHRGDGNVATSVRIRIEKGKIVELTKDDPSLSNESLLARLRVSTGKKFRLLDYRRRVVTPGFLAASSRLASKDSAYNLTPDLAAADNFDPYANYKPLLAAGITTLYLDPGTQRLMPGLGSVIKLGGKAPAERVVARASALRINLTKASRRVPMVLEPVMSPTSDDPLRTMRRQEGNTRISQIEVLRKAFQDAKDPNKDVGGLGPAHMRYALRPLRDALAGKIPVRLVTDNAADLQHGLDLLLGLGLRVILDTPSEADRMAARIAELQLSAVVSMPLRPGATTHGDFDPNDPELRIARANQAGRLAKSGVEVSIVPSADADLPQLRLLAGLACKYGLPRTRALASITRNPARALGVADRVGTLEPGKDADFVVLSGAPFDARSRVEKVYIDGILAFESSKTEEIFALRVGRLLHGDGSESRNAVLLVQGKKIVDAGESVSVPPGARVYEYPNAVLVPGYIDASSKLGLHQDGTRGRVGQRVQIPAATSVDVAAALDPEDKAFAPALEAGVTTVFVTPDDSGTVGGRVAAVHTGGKDSFRIESISGIRMRVSSGGSRGKAQIAAILKKAKDYFAKEKAAAQPKPAAKPASPAKPAASKSKDPVTGTWRGTISGPMPRPVPMAAELKLEGSKVTGRFTSPISPQAIAVSGTYSSGKLTLEATFPGVGKIRIDATIQGSKLTGKAVGTPVPVSFNLTRVSGASSQKKPASTAAAPKKERKKNPALEPFRAILAGKAPLVVRASNRDAAQAAVDAICKDAKLRLVLTGAAVDIAKKGLEIPSGCKVAYLMSVDELLYRKKDKVANLAELLSDKGLSVVLVTRTQTGTSLLPVHVAYAVAEGWDARLALRSVTTAAAEAFGLDQKIGSLRRGRSADFVLLDGDPFDLQSRTLGVWVAGVRKTGSHEETLKALEEVK